MAQGEMAQGEMAQGEMAQAVLLGDPRYFRIKAGGNPHTRTRWGKRKKVDRAKARAQWEELKSTLIHHGVKVHVLPPVEEEPGLVFPANAGFRYRDTIFLSHLNPGRAGEKEHYRRFFMNLGFNVQDLPDPYRFEGEADFIRVGDPSGDPDKAVYLFTYGRIESPRWVPYLGIPPYRLVYGFRSDRRTQPFLQSVVGHHEILPLELVNEAHYHGDTVLCPFGPHEEFILVYLEGLSGESQEALRRRFGNRLVPLEGSDGQRFAANSFQIATEYYGQRHFCLLMPDGLSLELYAKVRARGVVPCPVDVSEFLEKGGGAVKCLLFNLGGVTGSATLAGFSLAPVVTPPGGE